MAEPIAVIGTGCRFPGGADTPSKLWSLIHDPKDLSRKPSTSRFNIDSFYHPVGTHHGTTNATKSYWLDDGDRSNVTQFDAGFFNIQPTEADAMDPQQRLLMEVVYDSLCAAGQPMEKLRGSDTAVYVGSMCDDYNTMLTRDWETLPRYTATGLERGILANRISYFFDWHGPSLSLDTACSSSLVALDHAVQTIRSGRSKIAVAAGTSLILSPAMYISESNLGMLSPNGRCAMWDIAADGYARGEGVAAVILKPLSKALADNDPIDCIIRETGVNQDGRTPGLTMPSSFAQAALIRQCYAKAGLDPINNALDRPQFFQAHGTGTQAGDPQEAEAIMLALFPPGSHAASSSEKLLVGSVKTVIGHTEGTAGLASLITTSLALKHGIVPPNLHFENLSPKVAPFYEHLKIPTTPGAWPSTNGGVVRRASVNSFGFGGTNAHCILEMPVSESTAYTSKSTLFTPLLFSAASATSLRTMLSWHLDYLRNNPDVKLTDLAYTLQHRRSTLPYRTSIAARDTQAAIQILESIESPESGVKRATDLDTRFASSAEPKIIGIFTGQGAQWARMGSALIESSPFASSRIDYLDAALQSLGGADDRPSWTIRDQLLLPQASSRIAEAALSQPLCTAVQILLVDILHEAGIHFTAVVGHSSGEIGAAYAAGLLSAQDAVRIAYFRGVHAKRASSPNPHRPRGAMMAIGASPDDAESLCREPRFAGRLQVAAVNSNSSITLSGDEDAIDEAEAALKAEGTFARKLKVDTAYHSAHMLSCADAYLVSLASCDINYLQPAKDSATTWFSSVYKGSIMTAETLTNQYWMENMCHTVEFAGALSAALEHNGAFDIALEVGPHAALQGPALSTLNTFQGGDISTPYTSLLSRGQNDIDQLSSALGYIWTRLGSESVRFSAVQDMLCGDKTKSVVQDLPPYPFDHHRSYWISSRIPNHFKHRDPNHVTNPVLGNPCSEATTPGEFQWRKILQPTEMSWLKGHMLQGQTVFPATGYVSMAVEAAITVSRQSNPNSTISLIKLREVTIPRAIAFDDDSSTVEIIFSVTSIHIADQKLTAEWACYSVPEGAAQAVLNAKGGVCCRLSQAEPSTLPAVKTDAYNLVDVDEEELYSNLSSIGYDYASPFRGLSNIHRKLDYSIGDLIDQSGTGWDDNLTLHPGMLDSALQTVFAAWSYPGDTSICSLHVPVSISSITINPYFTALRDGGKQEKLRYETYIRSKTPSAVVGDIYLAPENDDYTFIQFEGATLVPFARAVAKYDLPMFSKFQNGVAFPDGQMAANGETMSDFEIQMYKDVDRAAYWFTRNASLSIPPKDRLNILPHFQRYLSWCDRMVDMVSQDAHPKVKPECNADSRETITQLLSAYEGRKDIRFVEVVGDNLVDVIRAGTSMLEHMNQDGLLRAFYEENAICSGPTGRWLARVISQIAHRNPSLDIFEVGAGTGATTSAVLNEIGDTYASYTFTDISSGFFIDAEERFTNQAGRMVFKTFNMEKEPSGQGFTEGVYDVALAVNVLHVSADLEASLSNVRRLLKSGGFLVVAELTSTDLLFSGMTVGTLPGWWIGAETGRPWGPLLSLRQWDSTLKQAGFSGIDTLTPDISSSLPMSVFVTQAVNDQINLLRNPLAVHERPVNVRNEALAVVGGMTLPVHKLGQKVSEVLSHRFQDKQHFETMEDFVTSRMATSQTPVTVLSLVDLDRPYLEDLTAAKFDALKVLWAVAGTVLWVTCGSKADRPYSQMMKGIVRTVQTEYPNLRVQMYDLDPKVNGGTGIDQSTAAELAVDLLREHILNEWGTDNNLLWTSEPEVSVSEGKKLVTRLIPDLQRNQRYNSRRRDVIATTDTVYDTVQLVAVEQGNKDWSMEVQKESPLEAWSCPTTSHRNVRIEFSTLQSLPVGGSARFRLCLGSDQDTGETIIALTGSSSSLAKVPKTRCLPIDQIPTPTLLLSIGHSLVAEHLLSLVPQGGTLLVNEPGLDLQTALRAKAGVKRVRTVFISAAAQHDEDASLILDPNLPQHVIKNIIPGSVSVFVHYSHNTASDAVRDAVLKYLPSGCLKIDGGDVLGFETNASLTHEADITVASVLKIALDDRLQVDGSTKSVDCVDLEEVTRHKRCGGPLRVVDWAATRFVNAKVQPIDKGTLFQADRTYLFVGMAGELGQSIAEWMIKHGAGNIVLTSRTPKVNGKFIEDMRKRYRAVVKALPLDITSRQSLDHALDEIRSQMPSIGGIINGAMVLEDELFSNMTLESFRRVTAPKVLGTQLLDQAFYNDTSLDFFIVTSSIASIIGWTGQSNYSAANEWMTSLAYSRRARGVAASVVNIPAVLGVGYAAHAEFFDFNYFQSLGHINISEEDLHTLFAEAVLSGRPGQDSNVEAQVCMGVNFISPDLEVKVSHKRDVKFSHFIKREEKSVDFKAAKASVRGKVQIESAETPEEIYGIARDAFWAHLKRLLRVPAEEELDDTTGLVDRGVDSLVAVDIRAWFLKELGVDVPTLKILGGGSVAELIKTALERMAEAAAAVVVASTDSSGVSSQSRSPTFTPAAPSSEAASSVESESGENPELIDG